MMKNIHTTLGIIDAQRGFMPAQEGDRLGLGGFGELPITDGQAIVAPLNKLLLSTVCPEAVFTTQDWHPLDTAHFSDTPNFTDTWPVHCVAHTLGAKLHPFIELPEGTVAFKKGFEKIQDPSEDKSYSGLHSRNTVARTNPRDDRYGPERIIFGPDNKPGDRTILYLAGLALDYCVKATALDFKNNYGNTYRELDVVVLSDAVKPVAEETGKLAVAEMIKAGIRMLTVAQAIQELQTIKEFKT